jgi:hypothetical protein
MKIQNEKINNFLNSIKINSLEIENLLKDFEKAEEDLVYRFYHQSFKVFFISNLLQEAKTFFENLAPDSEGLNAWFTEIIDTALAKRFTERTNENWRVEIQPVLEAFWHCKYFLEQMDKYGKELDESPQILPSGWAAVLYLYNLR